MQAQRNVANLLVVNSDNTTLTHSNNIDAEVAGMFVGEAAVITPGGVILDAATTVAPEFKIATKLTDGTLNVSDIIKSKSIKSINVHKYVAPTTQLDYIGYNGTTGAIDVINNNIYAVKLYLRPSDVAGFMQQKIKEGFYETDSTATQYEIAYGLTNSLIKNFSKEPDKVKFGTERYVFERINSGAQADAVAAATVSVAHGSTAIVTSDDETAVLTTGVIVRFGTSGAGVAPCYKIVGNDGGAGAARVYYLDIPYQGATNAAYPAATFETVTEGNWGIKISSTAFYFETPKFRYSQPIWDTILQDCGTTPLTKSTKASLGVGDYRAVREIEQLTLGNLGNYYRAQIPQPTFRSEVSSAKTYALITIEYEDNMATEMGGFSNSLKQLIIACEKGAGTGYTHANTGLGTTLNKLVTAFTIPLTYTTSATIATEINS